MNPLVSVNIRTFNSIETIEETLLSVVNQNYPNYEIIVADGSSNDGTLQILKKYKCQIVVADKLGDARYQNIINSKGKYVLSLDSDQTISKNLISKCVAHCEHFKTGAIIIPEKSIKNQRATYLERLLAYDKSLIDKKRNINNIFDSACPRFFKRGELLKFDWPERITIFDDAILYSKLVENNVKVSCIHGIFIRHHEVKSWLVLGKKYFKYGKGYLKSLKESPVTIAAHSMPRVSYFSFDAIRKPDLFFGLFFLYIFKVIFSALGMVSFVVCKGGKKYEN